MVTSNGNGTYGVDFHVNGQNEYVTVNNSLPNDCNTGANIWGSLLEKAYTELQTINLDTGGHYNNGNSFTTIGNGGTPEVALEAITADNAGNGTTISAPVPVNRTWNQSLAANHAFSFFVGNDITDPQSETLTYNVTLSNGQSLPSWISFNAQTDTLSGTTPLTSATEQIQVTATDTSGLSVKETFTISDTAMAPTLVNVTPTETTTQDKVFSFTLPVTTFVDPQGETLLYAATLSNGQALPSWLTFNTKTQTFSGTAPSGTQSLFLSVTATNHANLSTRETFSCRIVCRLGRYR